MRDWNLPREGGGRCGQVRIKISGPPLVTIACHCTDCQRMSSSGFFTVGRRPQFGVINQWYDYRASLGRQWVKRWSRASFIREGYLIPDEISS